MRFTVSSYDLLMKLSKHTLISSLSESCCASIKSTIKDFFSSSSFIDDKKESRLASSNISESMNWFGEIENAYKKLMTKVSDTIKELS